MKNLFRNKKVLRFILVLLVIVLLLFIINKLIPVKNVSDDNIKISLSTTKPTGDRIKTTIITSTKYNLFYYIDYKNEDDYYEETTSGSYNEFDGSENISSKNTDFENTTIETSKNTSNSTNKDEFEIKNIENKLYKKMTSSQIDIERNCVVYLKYGRFGKLSKIPFVFQINNIDKLGPEIWEISTTATDSSITVTVNATDTSNANLTYYYMLGEDGNYLSTGSKNKYTFSGLTTDETFTIYVKVVDKFGNATEAVTDAVASSTTQSVEKKIYYFKVNLATNTVTVYDKDEKGEYKNPIKVMTCSVGKATPKSGTYKTNGSYRWLALVGGVYGQYATRIYKSILFHSVPYLQMYPDTLEYEEFDKLGTKASAGCVRLTVKDAKWIYDNAKIGSFVEFYSDSDDPGPLGKPTIQKISGNTKNRNWDPTDPDSRNPWNGGTGVVNKNTVIINQNNNNNNSSSNTTNTVIVEDNSSNEINNEISNTVLPFED